MGWVWESSRSAVGRPRITSLVLVWTATALLIGTASGQQKQGQAVGNEELLRLVRELSDRVAQLEKRLGEMESDDGGSSASREKALSTRVDELERNVEEIKDGALPPADSEEWARMKKTFSLFSTPNTFHTYWKDGLRFDSLDESFKLKIGGRIQWDWSYYLADDEIEDTVGSLDDGTEFRRARIYLSGMIHDNIDFKVEFDFAGGDADFKDVYMGIRNVPYVGNLRFGHFKEPFSIEELTSSNDVTFMERSLVNTLAPSRNAGIMMFDSVLDDRMTLAAGIFRETDDFADGDIKRDWNATARVTGLPWYAENGRKLLHVGFAYTHKNYEDDTARFRQRPESHRSPRFADTGDFSAEYADIIGVELACVHGSFSLQGEYAQAFVESRTRSDPTFWAASIQAGYFLTGEHRPYQRSTGTFDRVRPLRNFGKGGGWGAWELAARYSHLDLNNAHIDGGELRDFSLGLNWYLNPNMRIMCNYVRADLVDDGDANIFQARFQVSF